MKAFGNEQFIECRVIIQTMPLDQRGHEGFGWENTEGNRGQEKQTCLGQF
jgi:hypothetical protein